MKRQSVKLAFPVIDCCVVFIVSDEFPIKLHIRKANQKLFNIDIYINILMFIFIVLWGSNYLPLCEYQQNLLFPIRLN